MLYPNVCLSFRLLNKRSTYSHLEAVKISNHRAESIRSHVRHVLLPMLKNLPVQANKNIDSKITTKNDECKNLDNNNQTLRSGFYRIGRLRYTLMEDEAIMKYLLENNLWRYGTYIACLLLFCTTVNCEFNLLEFVYFLG